jgi:hypothetical protein
MSEHDHDGFYWEPSAQDDLRQGDLMFNVPIALMPQRPRFVLGPGEDVKTEPYDDYPENAPSDQIVVEAVFGALAMVVTPTCHIAEGEKDQEIIAVVPVQPLNLVIPSIAEARNVLAGNNVPLHLFPLRRTERGAGILRFNGVALLDRPASMLKENLRDFGVSACTSSRESRCARRWRASGREGTRTRASSARCVLRSRTGPLRIWSDDRDCAGTAETVSPTRQI